MRQSLPLHLPVVVLVLALLAGSAAAENNVEKFDCDTADGWAVTNFKPGQTPSGAQVGTSDGSVALGYRRDQVAALVHTAMLTELIELRITLQSARDIQMVIGISDLDGARFHYVVSVPAGKWTDVTVKPADFRPSDDSPVKKRAVEPQRLGIGYALLDVGALQGASGENAIRVDRVEIETPAMEHTSGEWIIERPTVVSKSRVHDGNVIVRKGASLKISAPRARLSGSLIVEDGSVDVVDCVLAFPQVFNHQYRVDLQAKSKWKLRNSALVTLLPLTVRVHDGTSFTAEHVACVGGMTVELSEGGKVTLDQVQNPGEFVIAVNAELRISGSSGVMLWLTLGPDQEDDLTLPDGAAVESWSAGNGLDVKLKDCTNVMWGVLSVQRGKGSVVNSRLRGCGIICGGSSSFELKDLQNRRDLVDFPITLWDRSLRFRSSRVEAFNVYTTHSARLRVEASTIGEAMTFGESRIDLDNTVVDGTGGYVGATESSTIRLRNCKLHCLVLARDNATIILENCELNGPVRATGSGTITLQGCIINGRVENDPGAKLVIIPGRK